MKYYYYIDNDQQLGPFTLEELREKRIKKTTPQVTLNAEHRKKNIRGAFELNKKIKFENSSVILVDDVLTTGATSNECARILKKAGAEKVYLIVLAR